MQQLQTTLSSTRSCTTILMYAKNYDKMLDERQKAFLELVMTPNLKGTNSFTEKISRLVEEAKQNSLWRKQFMDLEREKARKFREGLLEGAQQNAIENAKNFLAMGVLSVEQVAQGTNLPLETVQELQKTLKKKN